MTSKTRTQAYLANFDFLAPDDIRVKGTREGKESILYEYIYQQRSPEEILKHFSIAFIQELT